MEYFQSVDVLMIIMKQVYILGKRIAKNVANIAKNVILWKYVIYVIIIILG